jgi:general secretion pathway protein K
MRQKMDVAQASAMLSQSQAQIYAYSVEDIAKAGLSADWQRDQNSGQLDSSAEAWAMPIQYQINGVQFTIQLTDLQGKFNLNSLHPTAPNAGAAKARFQRLLGHLALDTSIADELANWFDINSNSANNYLAYSPAYRSSGLPMNNISELLLLEKVDATTFEKLSKFVTALPVDAVLNLNTTSKEVLASWDGKLSLDDAQTVLDTFQPKSTASIAEPDRGSALKSVDDFWTNVTIAPLVNAAPSGSESENKALWDKADFDVKTQYFSVATAVMLGERTLALYSLVFRDTTDGSSLVAQREYAPVN